MSIPTNLNPLGREKLVIPTDNLIFYHKFDSLNSHPEIGESIVLHGREPVIDNYKGINCLKFAGGISSYYDAFFGQYSMGQEIQHTVSLWFAHNNYRNRDWKDVRIFALNNDYYYYIGLEFSGNSGNELKTSIYYNKLSIGLPNTNKEFNHIVLRIYQPSGWQYRDVTIEIFINGKLSTVHKNPRSTNPISLGWIGHYGDGNTGDHYISTVRSYKRLLTDKEILALYKELKPIY